MPRFYFDAREGERFAPDETGLEFDNLDAVKNEAACLAAEIARDRLPMNDTREVTIEVRNTHRQRVLTITLTMEIDQVDPPRGNGP
ncbi:DUF6894 family protein [Microvirga massiliensis]|uniref:DUF6894 family protein n=1 Tax=Microvirga massiliensis TaxID=1033741 RepID=UPI00062B2F76|nr:hypothetical protein [Microvirga massiliensis]